MFKETPQTAIHAGPEHPGISMREYGMVAEARRRGLQIAGKLMLVAAMSLMALGATGWQRNEECAR